MPSEQEMEVDYDGYDGGANRSNSNSIIEDSKSSQTEDEKIT